MDFTGTWDVVSSPNFDDEYLRLGGAPYITFRQNGDFVKGEYDIGVVGGTINGGAHSDFVDFHFQGNDAMGEAFGEGHARRVTPDLRALTIPGRRVDLRVRAEEVEALYPIPSSSFMKFRLRLYSARRSSRYSSNSASRSNLRMRSRTLTSNS